MPFEIVRNDIVNMRADAIVNTANPEPIIGYGCDAGIHKAAGPLLLKARKKIGRIDVGQAAITPGFDLYADYVIHAVGPVWQGGDKDEARQLRDCYDNSLRLAAENGCESIAFPLLSAGNHGFPKPLALQTAISAFSSFLLDHDMMIYLVVFGRDSYALSEKLFSSVASYIDENYIIDKTLDEYGVADKRSVREAEPEQINDSIEHRIKKRRRMELAAMKECSALPPMASIPLPENDELPDYTPICSAAPKTAANTDFIPLLEELDAGFSETLLSLIDRTGKKDSEIYKKANIDRKLFSKIRNNASYKPSKPTALAFAIALELDLEETKDFIGRAGFALTHSSKFDIIVEYFIKQKNYDVFELNEVLFAFDQPLIGA